MNFSIIGASGYIASRHVDAIKSIGGNLKIYHDIKKNESLDKDGALFIESEDTFFDIVKNEKIDFCVVCCPNFLHFEMIVRALNAGAKVISEKPLCLTKNEFSKIKEISIEKNLDVFSIMQLRLHPVANKLKKLANELNRNNKNQISNIKFITPRDDNYINSWKTDEALSGGILFNLGIHYFDLLIQSFGNPTQSDVEYINKLNAKGKTSFKNLTVNWIFSIVPSAENNSIKPERLFTINDQDINFSKVENDLHIENYAQIINHKSFSIQDIEDTMDFMFDINKH